MVYKTFIRPHLDYTDIVYDKANNDFFNVETKNIQHRTYLAFRGHLEELHLKDSVKNKDSNL